MDFAFDCIELRCEINLRTLIAAWPEKFDDLVIEKKFGHSAIANFSRTSFRFACHLPEASALVRAAEALSSPSNFRLMGSL